MYFLSILLYEGEDKVVAFTGEYKDEDIVKFIQGEQLALLTKFSVRLASIKTLGRSWTDF